MSADLWQQLRSALSALDGAPPGVPQLEALAAEALLRRDLPLQLQQPLGNLLRARHAHELPRHKLRMEYPLGMFSTQGLLTLLGNDLTSAGWSTQKARRGLIVPQLHLLSCSVLSICKPDAIRHMYNPSQLTKPYQDLGDVIDCGLLRTLKCAWFGSLCKQWTGMQRA